jgi:hypothetical protein
LCNSTYYHWVLIDTQTIVEIDGQIHLDIALWWCFHSTINWVVNYSGNEYNWFWNMNFHAKGFSFIMKVLSSSNRKNSFFWGSLIKTTLNFVQFHHIIYWVPIGKRTRLQFNMNFPLNIHYNGNWQSNAPRTLFRGGVSTQ